MTDVLTGTDWCDFCWSPSPHRTKPALQSPSLLCSPKLNPMNKSCTNSGLRQTCLQSRVQNAGQNSTNCLLRYYTLLTGWPVAMKSFTISLGQSDVSHIHLWSPQLTLSAVQRHLLWHLQDALTFRYHWTCILCAEFHDDRWTRQILGIKGDLVTGGRQNFTLRTFVSFMPCQLEWLNKCVQAVDKKSGRKETCRKI
jgi:hypothetical protein